LFDRCHENEEQAMRAMRGLIAVFFILTGLTVAALELNSRGDSRSKTTAAAPVASDADDQFIVHEWGTFTSFSGSDSVKLEFRPLADADLPPFVLDRERQSGNPNPFKKIDYRALQRMETPVTYFYSHRERQASVRVGFPQGLLTEFYPPVEQMQPEYRWENPEVLAGSVLDWGNVWIIPESRLEANVADRQLAEKLHTRMCQRLVPRAIEHEHYTYARETDSALVYVQRAGDPQHPLAPKGEFFEKFLFYRGIGNFELPLKVAALPGERFEVQNEGQDAIGAMFLVTVEGERLRFIKSEGIEGGKSLTLAQTEHPSSADELAEAVVAALVAENLYEKEARAMVKTWRSSWFGEDGTRLFYMLPRTVTDTLLPLEISPQPDAIVRVLVGRLEIMRPEDETRVTELVKQSAVDRAFSDAQRRANPQAEPYPLPPAIIQLGRLAEPALVRVKALTNDAGIANEAKLLLEQLHQFRRTLAAAKP